MKKRLFLIPLVVILLAVIGALVWQAQPHPQPVTTYYAPGTSDIHTAGGSQSVSQATKSDGTVVFSSSPSVPSGAPPPPLVVRTQP